MSSIFWTGARWRNGCSMPTYADAAPGNRKATCVKQRFSLAMHLRHHAVDVSPDSAMKDVRVSTVALMISILQGIIGRLPTLAVALVVPSNSCRTCSSKSSCFA